MRMQVRFSRQGGGLSTASAVQVGTAIRIVQRILVAFP